MATPERVRADFSQTETVPLDRLEWIDSPLQGVRRKPLDRIGGEVARATTVVEYAPGSAFSAHRHELGEEFLVLDGVFEDEHGNYPAGTYVRNPPGSRHVPRSEDGCVIFVKLRQMGLDEKGRVVVRPEVGGWQDAGVGHHRRVLFEDVAGPERVSLERLDAGARAVLEASAPGIEILLLEGTLDVGGEQLSARAWYRSAASKVEVASPQGALFWMKTGHLQV